jgi:hypothetical protein
MVTPNDIELIAMILQRASVNQIEAQWINMKLDGLRALAAQSQAEAQKREAESGGAKPPDSLA